MAINKIFANLDVNKLARRKKIDFTTELSPAICDYAFSVVWSNSLNCNLTFLSGNRPPSTLWHPIITHPISDNDGEISVSLGHFPSGTSLKLSYGIQAVDAIPRLAVLVVNINNHQVLKIPAGNQFKALTQGELWQNSITINLP